MSDFFKPAKQVEAIPPPYEHQQRGTSFQLANTLVYDASDPGTGKTRTAIDAIVARGAIGGKVLVLAPKSILQPAWGEDIKKFSNLTYSIAYAKNRAKAFKVDADVYITNHDAAKWIADNINILSGFNTLIIDEVTAFKHRTSQRSKAALKISKLFDFKVVMSGTPNTLSITDIWHQVLLLDGGQRLGKSFWGFRQAVCEPIQTGPRPEMVEWRDKPESSDAVADLLSDITIRNKFEDCISIPPNTVHTINFDLSPSHLKTYNDFKADQIIQVKDGSAITAIHGGALKQKLLQLASGAVYDGDKAGKVFSTERYELTMELANQREQCLISFSWHHQRDELIKICKKMGMSYGVIDGKTKDDERDEIITMFQAGKLDNIFAHPKSAAHGLTLTSGTTTIWSSPVHNAEWFTQFNKRLVRNGQKNKTETLLISANDTIDAAVYSDTDGKLTRMNYLLELLEE